MADDVIQNMRKRAARCRQLSNDILNERDSALLRKMAEEIEADIERLEKETANPISPRLP